MLLPLILLSSLVHTITAYPTNVSVSILCHELNVVASWNATDFGGGAVTRVEWNDDRCDNSTTSDGMVTSSINFNECGSIITQLNDTILQENTARLYVSYQVDIIQRVVIYSFKTQCAMSRSIHTGEVGYNVTEKRIDAGNATSVTDFNVRMDIYSDDSYNNVMVNTIVSSFDPLYIGIKEVNDNQLLKFVAHQCFATRTSDRTSSPKYTFFDNKCPIDSTYEQLNSNDDSYNFKINAFRFQELSQSVYIHCKLSVCKTNSTSDKCTQTTNCGRKRRHVADNIRQKREVTDFVDEPVEEITVMTKKLTFTKPTCNEMRANKCPSFSTCEELDQRVPVCRCGHGYVYKPLTNKCVNRYIVTITGLHFDAPFRDEYRDPFSRGFMQFAIRVESQLQYYIEKLGSGVIEGVKVVAARPGSVIVDVDLVYAPTSSGDEAYKVFLQSIQTTHVNDVGLADGVVIKNVVPLLSGGVGGEVSAEVGGLSGSVILVLAVVVPVAGVVLVAVLVAVVVRRRSDVEKHGQE